MKSALTKAEIFLCIAIGNLSGAVFWNPPARAWDLATGFTDMMNGIHDSLAPGRGQAQSPLSVPQMQAPIGNSNSAQPCLAPPPTMAASPTEQMPTASNKPASSSGIKHYSDPIARVLMNTAPGNKMSSLLNRVHYPRRFDDVANYWETDDGTIAVTNDENDRVTAIWMVK